MIFQALKQVGVAIAATLVVAAGAGAQTYPDRPVKVIIGTAPGGAVDTLGRIAMTRLSELAGQPFVIENIPGPYNGLKKMVESPADGYTLMLQSTTLTVTKALFPKIDFDPARVAPVGLLADSALVMVTRKGLASSVQDVVKLAKARPESLTYGSAGFGSPPNLAGEMFKQITGTNILHVPYKGVAPALADVAAGRIDIMFTSYASVHPFMQTDRVDALAVTTAKRAKQVPQLPTLVEAGYRDMVASTWVGLIAPHGTPDTIVLKLNSLLNKALEEAPITEKLLSHGFEVNTGTPSEFAELLARETARNTQTVQRAGIKVR